MDPCTIVLLCADLRKIVYSFITEHKTFARASQVSKLWKNEVEVAWKAFSAQQHLLDELTFVEEQGRTWKWLIRCKIVRSTGFEEIGFVTCNGLTYEGEWNGDKREGLGIHRCPNIIFGHEILSYIGHWKENKMDGKGICKWADGKQYEGEWKEGEMQGKGTFKFNDGEQYDGEWKRGNRHGKGIFRFPDGDRYEGEWECDQKHGKGTFTWVSSGDRYDGEWKEGKKHGKGIFQFSNGDRYEGDFKQDKMHGQGIYESSDGNRYEGEWIEDIFAPHANNTWTF